ncbi:MAG TPA: DNA replication and repair protein RecF, partial [Candidatus Saccharimonadales bacterium]|nr:DNA replication and repair protein RecF [Candidatus Saccharimonadales bacterium]
MYTSLRLQRFRSYTDFTTPLTHGVTVIVGPNGSGKTNLLEAMYVLSMGGSFRAGDRDLLAHDQEWFKVDGVWVDQKRSFAYRVRGNGTAEKQFEFDGVKKARLTHNYSVPVVLFEPDHLRLLRASPSGRRDYLDSLLAKLYPDFTWLKHQFERVLQQRNAVLKRHLSRQQREDHLFVWDIRLAELAKRLVERRMELVGAFNTRLAVVYSAIAQKASALSVVYATAIDHENYQAQFLHLLHTSVERDVERGFTSHGPHRDDFVVTLANSPAASSASRGEMRSILLAFKIIELELLAECNDKTPILLLDDVFSELDASRCRALAQT